MFPNFEGTAGSPRLRDDLSTNSSLTDSSQQFLGVGPATTDHDEELVRLGLPADGDFASVVHNPTHKNLLLPQVLPPLQQAGSLMRVYLTRSPLTRRFLRKAPPGQRRRRVATTLRDENGHTIALGNLRFVEFHQGHQHRGFILQNARNTPLTLLLQHTRRRRRQKRQNESDPVHKSQHQSYGIYGTRPLIDGDEPVAREHDVYFYPWYLLEERSTAGSRSLKIWNGQDYESLWTCKQPATTVMPPAIATNPYYGSSSSDGATTLANSSCVADGVFPPTSSLEELSPSNKLALLVRGALSTSQMGHFVYHKDGPHAGSWQVSIPPGVDPALMLCMAVLLDDMLIGCRRAKSV